MSETILFQNDSKSVTVLDLPRSIQHGQRTSASLKSSAATQVPYPSTEPKGRKRENLFNEIPKAERKYHEEIYTLLTSALLEARSSIGDGDWCFARTEQCISDEAPQLAIRGSEGYAASLQPPLFLSSTFKNYVPALADFRRSLVVNSLPATSIVDAEACVFFIPPRSAFLCTTIADGLHLIKEALTSNFISTGLTASCFDLVLLDPPWANRSVRHARTYRTAETQDDPFDEVLPLLRSYVAPNGIVAVWITNKNATRSSVVQALSDIGGFKLFEEWIWLKVTQKGDPVTEIDGLWRRPYEVLLLFNRSSSPSSIPQRRVLIAVPDLHSRKPCLKQLIEPLLPQPYFALEIFARSLTAGWWSWGDECLKYQHASQWDLYISSTILTTSTPNVNPSMATEQTGSPMGAIRKAFVPLENNPEVMTNLAHELGLSPKLQFHEVYSLTEPSLLEFLPRPALALLLVFPVSPTYEKHRFEEDSGKQDYDGSGGEPVVWYKQTIKNACGLIGLLHCITNGEARQQIVENSNLHKLLQEALSLKPTERAALLYESEALEAAHQTAAQQGDTTAPAAEAAIDLHFVAFVKDVNGDLWELDGGRKGPLNRGHLGPEDDLLSEKGQELGVQAFLRREADVRFSVIMLGESFD